MVCDMLCDGSCRRISRLVRKWCRPVKVRTDLLQVESKSVLVQCRNGSEFITYGEVSCRILYVLIIGGELQQSQLIKRD